MKLPSSIRKAFLSRKSWKSWITLAKGQTMPTNSQGPFKVVCSDLELNRVRQLLEKAAESGTDSEVRSVLRTIHHKLTADPVNWGDPQNNLPHLGLVTFHRMLQMFQVRYAVDQKRRIVYIRDIRLRP